MAFSLSPLPYAYTALAPYIDAKTMELHHTKHHQGYIDNLNKALAGTEFVDQPIEKLLQQISHYSPAVRNHGGGHFNHTFFWSTLSPQSSKAPVGVVADKIQHSFGSYQQFQEEFALAAAARFGSGWAWLCMDDQGLLFICSTPNQDNPLMDVVDAADCGIPLLGLDVWEHAYYLQYQNRRAEYIAAFWHIVNWDTVERRCQEAKLPHR